MLCADTQQLPPDDKIYRVYICPNTSTITMTCIGMDSVDNETESVYHSVDALPLWTQEKIALLMMTALDKPTKSVEGVGRRIDANTYWVYQV